MVQPLRVALSQRDDRVALPAPICNLCGRLPERELPQRGVAATARRRRERGVSDHCTLRRGQGLQAHLKERTEPYMAISTAVPELTEAGVEAPGPFLRRSWTRAVDAAIGAAILTSGVVSRYVLHNALVWTDELATILLLWLSMLGAVIAYRNDAHMRL